MILLKGGRVINPDNDLDEIADVLIVGDRIALVRQNIGKDEIDEAGDGSELETIDCRGKTVGPGLVDIHVHFRDPGFTYKEDIFTGAEAAAAGGFTSVIMMANTKPAIDNEETLRYVLEKGAQTKIHVYSCANVTYGLKGEKLTDFEGLKKLGAIGFTDDGIPLKDEEIALKAMQEAAKSDSVLSFHEEDPKYITNNGVNRGRASEYYNIGGSDRQAEISMVARDLKLSEQTGAKINIQHISAKETLELIREAKKNNKYPYQHVFAEATPHHIALTEEDVIKHGTLAKMNPPLRTEEDRQAIIEAIKDDTIDFIATDHAPHSAEEKAKPITEAPSGIIGLETSFPIIYEKLVEENKFSLLKVFCKMSLNPARLYNISAGKLAKNEIADVVIIDENMSKKYEKTLSKSSNSPFFGHIFKAGIVMTICSGKIIYRI
ncbi:MAG: dihydroorotase [Lachnospiraceae bacterium]|nr:dihydroorotase [Lachnospiraceae bacterium]